mmetsp:Transcript_6346/g.19921  ORF Transcript_6346/g.19921 Transcript_6346/m.19921 type:complete len:344 (-) Transcript_6346:186-1217(-)
MVNVLRLVGLRRGRVRAPPSMGGRQRARTRTPSLLRTPMPPTDMADIRGSRRLLADGQPAARAGSPEGARVGLRDAAKSAVRASGRGAGSGEQARDVHRLRERHVELGLELREWEPNAWPGPAHALERPLDGDGIGLQKEAPVQQLELRIQLARARRIADPRARHHLAVHGGCNVTRHRNRAVTAREDKINGGAVVAAVQQKVGAAQLAQRRDAHHIAGRFLDPYDARVLAQRADRDWRHVDAGARRHVVEHERKGRVIGDVLVILDQPLLRGLHIIGRDHEHTVRAVRRRLLAHLDRGRGLDRAGADHHGQLAHRLLLRDAQHVEPFGGREGGGLAGSAEHH